MSELLFETDANPIPSRIRGGLFHAPDGKALRYALLKAESRPCRGTVIVLQGRNEFIENYYETMSDLAGRGFTVATFDWRGQGGSHRLLRDRLRGYVRSFNDYADDLDHFLTGIVLPDCRRHFSFSLTRQVRWSRFPHWNGSPPASPAWCFARP